MNTSLSETQDLVVRVAESKQAGRREMMHGARFMFTSASSILLYYIILCSSCQLLTLSWDMGYLSLNRPLRIPPNISLNTPLNIQTPCSPCGWTATKPSKNLICFTA